MPFPLKEMRKSLSKMVELCVQSCELVYLLVRKLLSCRFDQHIFQWEKFMLFLEFWGNNSIWFNSANFNKNLWLSPNSHDSCRGKPLDFLYFYFIK